MTISILLLGFLIGMRHALEADHVAAVSSLATQSNSTQEVVRNGVTWGLGHTITLFLFGTVSILVGGVMSESLAAGLEFIVGIMLIFLGLDVLRRMYKKNVHFHTHQHSDGVQHFHAHSHSHSHSQSDTKTHTPNEHQHTHAKIFPRRALIIGLIHGMAGSAALIILTVQTVQSFSTGMLYMLLFGIGSIGGMAILSAIIAIPLRYTAQGLTWAYKTLQIVVGVSTIILGSMTSYSYLSEHL